MPKRPVQTDPAELTQHERLRELASLLARGIHRLRARPTPGGEPEQHQAENSRTCLDLSARPSPDGTAC